MKLFQGLNRTDYQDVLRAIGLLLDERGYRNVRLIEHEEGIVVQGLPTIDGQVRHTYETFLLTDEDIQQLVRQTYRRRTRATPSGQSGSQPQPGRPLLHIQCSHPS